MTAPLSREESLPQNHAPSAPQAGSRRQIWERWAFLPLLLILLLGATFRFTGLNWDDTTHLHPDERFLTIVATQLQSTGDPLTYLRTSQSPLNPYNKGQSFYVYGNFPMTATRLAAEAATAVCQRLEGLCPYSFVAYDGVQLVGRFLSAAFDLLSILFTFLIARRLFDWRVGLLAALLLAAAVMPIQQSHFFTMDNWAASLATLSLYATVRAAEEGGRRRWWLAFGLGLGLAVASRINLAPLAGMAGVAALVWWGRQAAASGLGAWPFLRTEEGQSAAQQAVAGVALAAAVSIVVFRLAQPYAFMDTEMVRQQALAETGQEPGALTLLLKSVAGLNPQFLANMAEIQRLQSPEASFPPALQWTDRAPLLFPLTNMVLYGMGVTAGILSFLALFWALWHIARARPDWAALALPASWSAAYFLFMGTRWVKSIRYFLPIYPFLLMLAAWLLLTWWDRAGQGWNRRRFLALAAILGTVLPSLLWASAFVRLYTRPITRIAASAWIFEHVPSGATLLYQSNGQARELQLPLKGYDFAAGAFPVQLPFSLPAAGQVTAVRFNYLSGLSSGQPASLSLRLVAGAAQEQTMAQAESTITLQRSRQAVTVPLSSPPLPAGQPLTLVVAHSGGGPVHAGTSLIANEHWDDALPVRLEGRDPFSQYYSGVNSGQVAITNPDSEEKRQQLLGWLEESDVIALSSQRALWNTARLPLTYPLTMAYYQALFDGSLGFALAAQFHADLHIGPLYISDTAGKLGWGAPPQIGWPPPGDLAAEEAFSVYDHPPVWLFVKTEQYSRERAQALLGSVDLSEQMFMTPGQATQAPNGLALSPEAEAVQRANGTFSRLFDLDGLLARHQALAAAAWWLAAVLLGWLTFPLTFAVFRGLADRGFVLSRILALLLLSYFGWITASLGLLPNTRGSLLLGLGLLTAGSALLFWRQRHEILSFLRQQRHFLLLAELLGLALFLLFLGIRLGNPDAWDVIWGGEKPMDLSFFNAVLKSTTFPPYDPWFAGGYINYYYYGYVYVGSLTKLLGVVPTVAYNLILPMLFSFTGLGAFSLAYNLVAGQGAERRPSFQALLRSRAVMAGLAALALAVLLGNLAEAGVLFNAWQRASDSTVNSGLPAVDALVRTVDGGLDLLLTGKQPPLYPGDWFWSATRTLNAREGEVVPITEFPFFTFLYGDLHAHMISLPLMLLALGWAISLALEQMPAGDSRRPGPLVGQFLVGGLAIGVLRATNTWDLPTFGLIGAMALFYAPFRRAWRQGERLPWLSLAGEALLQTMVLGVIALVAFLPFAENYGVPYTSFRLWDGSQTYVSNYLSVYGLFLFLAGTHLAREFRDWSNGWTTRGLERLAPLGGWLLLGVFAYVLLVALLLFRGYWIGPIVLTVVVLAGILSLRPGLPPARRVVLALIASAFALTLMVEIVVLAGDIGRMNTVFKFYVQVWLLLSVAGGAALAWAWPARLAWGRLRRRTWQAALTLLLLMAALYPLLATRAKWQTRMNHEAPITLDGMAFLQVTSYQDKGQTIPLKDDYEAIRWLQENVEGSPVIAEANAGTAYRTHGNRVVMYTGLPTIVGWDWHERQQRAVLPGTLVSQRIDDSNTLYNTADMRQAEAILQKYSVRYIYVGQLERAYYQPEGLQKFAQMAEAGLLREVYRNSGVTIYEVAGLLPATH